MDNANTSRPERPKLSNTGRIDKLRIDAVARNRKGGKSDDEALQQADAWLSGIIAKADDLSDDERASCLAMATTPFDWKEFHARRAPQIAVPKVRASAPRNVPGAMTIPDDDPEPTPIKPSETSHRSGGRKPLTANGHLAHLVERLTKRFVDEGFTTTKAQLKAVGRIWHLVDVDKTLSDEDRDRLISELKAMRPTPPAPQRPASVSPDMVRDRFRITNNTLGTAKWLMSAIIGDDRLDDRAAGDLFNLIKEEVHQHFMKPLLEEGGTALEAIDEATRSTNGWMDRCFGTKQTRRPHGVNGRTAYRVPIRDGDGSSAPRAPGYKACLELPAEEQAKRRAEKLRLREERKKASEMRRNDPHFGEMRRPVDKGGKKKSDGEPKKKGKKGNAQANA